MKTIKYIIAASLTAVMLFCLSSCVNIGNIYENADKYTAGDRQITDEIDSVVVDWISGSVSVSRHDKNTVDLSETCNTDLEDSLKVHSWVDGKTLRIHFCKSGENLNNISTEKKLDIKLPKDIELTELSIDGTSTDTDVTDITAETIDLDLTSGDSIFDNCSANSFDIDTTSGNIKLTQTGKTDKIAVDTTSGDTDISAETVGEIVLDGTSGSKTVNVKELDSITADSTSGSNEFTFAAMPQKIDIDGTSSDVDLYVPKNAGFIANIDQTSGSFSSDLPTKTSNGFYTCGDGKCEISIDLTSGDVNIKEAK